jgi:hypothetical protein
LIESWEADQSKDLLLIGGLLNLLGGLLGSTTLLGSSLLGTLLNLLLDLLDGTSVDHLSGGDGDLLDQTLLLELTDGVTGKRTVDLKKQVFFFEQRFREEMREMEPVIANLHSVRNNGRSDNLVGGDLLHELIVSLLVKDNLVGKLVLNVTLGPLNGERRTVRNDDREGIGAKRRKKKEIDFVRVRLGVIPGRGS